MSKKRFDVEAELEAFDQLLNDVCPSHKAALKRLSNKKIKLAEDDRTHNVRVLMASILPRVLVNVILQYARGDSRCSRDNISCATCGLQCVDCDEVLSCQPLLAMAIPNFEDCPMCGEAGPRCGQCQCDHLQECMEI